MKRKIISASLLAADFSRLGPESQAALDAGVDMLHFDVMDHHFVPNLGLSPDACRALRPLIATAVHFDVHLMVTHPEALFEPFAKAGASLIAFHPETVTSVPAAVEKLEKLGCAAGLVFNPDQPFSIPAILAKKIRLIMMMTVYPGFAGQRFMPEVLEKISEARKWIDAHEADTLLGVDGGINENTIHSASKAGADFFVVGSGLFAKKDYAACVQHLRALL